MLIFRKLLATLIERHIRSDHSLVIISEGKMYHTQPVECTVITSEMVEAEQYRVIEGRPGLAVRAVGPICEVTDIKPLPDECLKHGERAVKFRRDR